MKFALPLMIAFAATAAAPALAQDVMIPQVKSVQFDVAVGAWAHPTYIGSDEHETGPWLSLRNLSINGAADGDLKYGFSLTPNFDTVGDRDGDDDDRLDGLDDISRAYEAGLKLSYRAGETTFYGTMRKGFGGHHGIVGEIGTRYRQDVNERFTFWAGAELKGGDSKFTDTYFGVSDAELVSSGYRAYNPGGGFYEANVNVEARYMLNENWAVLGRATYGRLLGDAADLPLVQDKNQPEISVGIVRHLNFKF